MRQLVGVFLSSLAAAVAPAPSAAAPPAAPISVLLISVDTLRADHVGAIGGLPSLTPRIDAWARTGTTFRSAYSVASVTQPALATILSGLYPSQHGHDSNLSSTDLPVSQPLLAELMKARGLRTAAFIAHPWVFHARFGFQRGFDHWDGVEYRDIPGKGFNISEEEYLRVSSAGPMTDRVLGWLGTAQAKPFFIWVHYLDPHDPYSPPPELVPSGRLPLASTGNPEWDQRRRMYAGEVANIDRHVDRLLRAAQAAAPGRRLFVVFTADHGEMLYDHEGFPNHGLYTYDSEIRVPLVLAGPGVPRATVDVPVSLIDLYPTLVAAAGCESPRKLPGLNLLAPGLTAKVAKRLAFAESDYYRGKDIDSSFARRCAKDGGKWYTAVGSDFKLVYYPWTDGAGFRTEFYDIADHRQLSPRAAPSALGEHLVNAIWIHAAGSTKAPDPTSEAQRDALRSLGYIK